MSNPPLVPATPNRPWWKQVIQVLITLTVLVVVFGFFIPQLADYRDVLDVIQDISPGEWLVLSALAGGVLVAYGFGLMAAILLWRPAGLYGRA